MTLTIRPVSTVEECRQIEELQIKIWDTDPIDVVPDHLLLTMAKNRGVVLLAREAQQPVGFCMSFQAETAEDKRKHCSHQTGVLPTAQSRGIGYRLKLAQREAILAQGIELITWTFDPLLSLNAALNLGKLGVISNIYYEKYYGNMRSAINAGLESDRLEVMWRLTSPHVEAKLTRHQQAPEPAPSQILNTATYNDAGNLIPSDAIQPPSETEHFIQIPTNIRAIIGTDLALATAWQQQIRTLFQTVFAAGYTTVDFVWLREQNKSYYLITKETDYYENRAY
jgi:predicted GNAT superfamily acetyltransferase